MDKSPSRDQGVEMADTRSPARDQIRPGEPAPTTIDLQGDLGGQSLDDLAARLTALADLPRPHVRLDLTAVQHMSVRAQVLLLSIARTMRLRGGELILYGPGRALRAEGMPVGLFGRIRTIDTPDR